MTWDGSNRLPTEAEASRAVRGQLQLTDNRTVVPNARIRILDVNLTGDVLLGDAPTDDLRELQHLRYSPTASAAPANSSQT